MIQTVQFPNTIELATAYVAAGGAIPTGETVAILCQGMDVVATTVAEIQANTQCTLYINYTKGAGETGIKIKIYDSFKGSPATFPSVDWYQETIEADAGGIATLSAFEIDLTASTGTTGISYSFPIAAVRSLAITIQSYGGGTPGAATLNLAFRTN